MHALPPSKNLPFQSFRLFRSIKKIDKEAYGLFERLYNFKEGNVRKILKEFKRAYIREGRLQGSKGFYDPLKINYNIRELRRTFREYPFFYGYRFILGCMVGWKVKKELLERLIGQKIAKELVEDKLEISQKLIERVEELK